MLNVSNPLNDFIIAIVIRIYHCSVVPGRKHVLPGTMQNLLDKYCVYRKILNFAEKTIKGQQYYLNRFITWLKGIGINELAAVTKDIIMDYQAHLFEEINFRGQPNSVFSQNRNLQAVKSFLRFLCENDYIACDPAKSVSYAKEPQRLPRSILTQSEAKKVLHASDTMTVLGYRDRTILEVLYSTGVRKEELLNILLTDVDYADGYIRINCGKGRKDRVVPVGKIACRYIENYIRAVRPSLIRSQNNTHLFLSLRGNRLSKNMIWEIVKNNSEKAKMEKNISPHTFRHTCATLMLRNNANIRHIQELLGHTSLDSTQVYAAVSITDLKEVHARCHPREKDRD
ncbi:MAG: tyrosine-type recombinase/integrase [Thermodesulfovibrionales bacterium]